MSDERLALVAEVVDRFSGPLTNLRKQLNDVRSTPHMAAMRKDFVEIEGTIGKAANTVKTSLAPALSSLSVASLGATLGIAGIGTAIANMVTGAADVRRFSNEVGISADKFRELNAVGQRFGIDTSAMQQALRQAQGTADDFRKHGQIYTDLMAQFPEMLGKPLAESKSFDEFVAKAIEGLMKIPNAAERARAATMIFGQNIFAGVKTDEFERAIERVREHLAKLPKGAGDAAEELRQKLNDIKEQITAIGEGAIIPLMPKIEQFVTGLSSIGTADVNNPELAKLVQETKDWIEKTDWTKAGQDFGGEFIKALNDASNTIKEISAAIQAVQKFRDDLLGGADKFNKEKLGGFQLRDHIPDAVPNWMRPDSRQKAEGPDKSPPVSEQVERALRERGQHLQELQPAPFPNALPYLPKGPTWWSNPTTDPLLNNKAAPLHEEMSRLSADNRTLETLDTPRAKAKLEENTQRLRELTEELRRLREGGATVQQQSFDATTPAANLIQRASFGGGGLGFRRPGGLGGSGYFGNGHPAVPGQREVRPGDLPGLLGLPEGSRENARPNVPLPPGGRPSVPDIGARPQLPGRSGGGRATPATRAETMGYMIDELRKQGVPEDKLRGAAAMLTGQADMESGLDPNAVHDNRTGYGIYGARDPKPGRGRKTEMLNWIRENGFAPNSLEGQARYMAREAMSGRYKQTRSILMSGRTDEEAVNTVTGEFESPAVINRRSGAVRQAEAFDRREGPAPRPMARPMARPMFPPAPTTRAELAERAGTADVSWPWGWAEGGARAGVAKGDRSMGAPPSADWFPNAMKETGSSPQTVDGNTKLSVEFKNLPKGSKVGSEMDGMFREIKIDRGRSMQAPQEI